MIFAQFLNLFQNIEVPTHIPGNNYSWLYCGQFIRCMQLIKFRKRNIYYKFPIKMSKDVTCAKIHDILDSEILPPSNAHALRITWC